MFSIHQAATKFCVLPSDIAQKAFELLHTCM